MSCGYRLALSPRADVTGGQLVDVTLQNPSHEWAAGALVSGLQELTCVLRPLLSGRLLPPRLLAEMLTAVPVPPGSLPVPHYDRYGLGLVVFQTPVVNVGELPWPTS
jgi:D-alanyl-D-alanine carboxypeptidase